MILSNLFAVLLGCTSAVLANELAPKHAKMRRLTRRDGVEECTKKLADETWAYIDAGFSAAICYHGAYSLTDSSPKGKKYFNTWSCEYKNWLGGDDALDYECFFMSAHNTFTANGDGGYRNLAMQYGSNCTWNHDNKTLTCA